VLEGVHEQLDKVTHTVDFRPRHESNSSNGLTTSHLTVLAETARSYSVDRAEATRSKGRSSSPNTTPAAMACSPSRDPITEPRPARSVSPPEKRTKRVRAAVGRRRPRPVSGPYRAGTNRRCRAVLPAETCCQNGTCARALDAVQRKFESPYGGHESPAGIWVEPIQGEGGVVVPPEGFSRTSVTSRTTTMRYSFSTRSRPDSVAPARVRSRALGRDAGRDDDGKGIGGSGLPSVR